MPGKVLWRGTPQMVRVAWHATDGPVAWNVTDGPVVWDAKDGPVAWDATGGSVWVNKRGVATIVANPRITAMHGRLIPRIQFHDQRQLPPSNYVLYPSAQLRCYGLSVDEQLWHRRQIAIGRSLWEGHADVNNKISIFNK